MSARSPTLIARLAVLLALVFASVGALRTIGRSGEALIEERGETSDDSELDALHHRDGRRVQRREGRDGSPATTRASVAATVPHVTRSPPPRRRWMRLRRVLAPPDDDDARA